MNIVGIDEVGVGALAGACLVCAAMVPEDWKPPIHLRDSKKMTKNRLDLVFRQLTQQGGVTRFELFWGSVAEIDELGIGQVLKNLFERAVQESMKWDETAEIIADGIYDLHKYSRCRSLVGADDQIPAVMAASVLAKVTRDRYVVSQLDVDFPLYRFRDHKGYPSTAHKAALSEHGPCPEHRMSYAPCRLAWQAYNVASRHLPETK